MLNTCRFCQKNFNTKQQKDAHENIHEGRKFQCKECLNYYSSTSSLSRHKKSMHQFKHDKETSTMFSVCGKEFVCGECHQFFGGNRRLEYNVHLEEHISKCDHGKVKYATEKR